MIKIFGNSLELPISLDDTFVITYIFMRNKGEINILIRYLFHSKEILKFDGIDLYCPYLFNRLFYFRRKTNIRIE